MTCDKLDAELLRCFLMTGSRKPQESDVECLCYANRGTRKVHRTSNLTVDRSVRFELEKKMSRMEASKIRETRTWLISSPWRCRNPESAPT